jgi:hypothetical protein
MRLIGAGLALLFLGLPVRAVETAPWLPNNPTPETCEAYRLRYDAYIEPIKQDALQCYDKLLRSGYSSSPLQEREIVCSAGIAKRWPLKCADMFEAWACARKAQAEGLLDCYEGINRYIEEEQRKVEAMGDGWLLGLDESFTQARTKEQELKRQMKEWARGVIDDKDGRRFYRRGDGGTGPRTHCSVDGKTIQPNTWYCTGQLRLYQCVCKDAVSCVLDDRPAARCAATHRGRSGRN